MIKNSSNCSNNCLSHQHIIIANLKILCNLAVPPEVVKVRAEPKEWTVGIEGKLTCDSSSSNPPARLSWWKDGIPVQGESNFTRAGLHGGTVSSIELKMNVTQDMDGQVYTCQAANEALQRSVNDVTTLHVLCKYFSNLILYI